MELLGDAAWSERRPFVWGTYDEIRARIEFPSARELPEPPPEHSWIDCAESDKSSNPVQKRRPATLSPVRGELHSHADPRRRGVRRT